MRAKLARRQAALSGRQDEEENDRARRSSKSLKAVVNAAAFVSKTKASTQGGFDMDRMSGLNALLEHKEAADDGGGDSDESWD